MHLDVEKCAQPWIPLLLCEIAGHHLDTNFCHPQFLSHIRQTVSWFMFASSTIILTVNLPSDRTNSLTRAVLSPVCVVDGRPLCCSSSTTVLPSENILCQRKACALDIASSPKTCWSFPCVVVTLSPSLTQKRWHTAARCSVLPFPQRGSQTHPDMWSTSSILRYCEAMPLQVEMEERPRLKAVCVSRMQYCQYS